MNAEMMKRIATIKTQEVENDLPRIHIDSQGTLFQLMVWRNRHKELVRHIDPILKEGVISIIHKKNYFYFLQESDDIYFMNKTGSDEYVAFLFNKAKSTVLPIANQISFYPKNEAVQDILTTYASCMAFLRYQGVSQLNQGETFTINKVTI